MLFLPYIELISELLFLTKPPFSTSFILPLFSLIEGGRYEKSISTTSTILTTHEASPHHAPLQKLQSFYELKIFLYAIHYNKMEV